MDDDSQLVELEIHAVIANSKTMQGPPGTFEFAEVIHLGLHHLLRQAAELAKDLELEFLGHAGKFSRTCWVKDDLEWAHSAI